MPMAVDGKLTEVKYTRPECAFCDLSQQFTLPDRTFNRQYAAFYCARYKAVRAVLEDRAREKWEFCGKFRFKRSCSCLPCASLICPGKLDVPITTLCDLIEDKRSVVVGTLFKIMELQPSILKEISEEHHIAPQPQRSHFTDNADSLVLEDDKQRLALSGNIDVHTHVTGVPIAVLGRVGTDGRFAVEDFCYAEPPEQIKRPLFKSDMFILLVSGVGLTEKADSLLPFQLLIDYVSGFLGCDADQERASHVVRVILAGNSLRQKGSSKDMSRAKFTVRKESSADASVAKLLDRLLEQLSHSVEVDVMPGLSDPAASLLPQQPMHPCLFPGASQRASLRCVTNPYQFELDGLRVLGTSGQNVTDVQRYSQLTCPLEIMEKTLQWRHLAPTCPDTLSCYPFTDQDPFILDSCPHVYFVGNQNKFATKLYKSEQGQAVRLVAVPSFCKTFTCVWLNMRTLECEPMSFDVNP
ncbi:hypothetical protein HPB51_009717 [Rhipicephalus microplus]|uniref:DNA polymerase delta subunit 2 n=1 Tax=Rhipicephalus microplus TaxID=6941 RepID=A0A9J6ESI9_RHIMP|nr:hypothetical protein HPB51_009717 [Rhipicephalus microplus]